MTATNVQLSVTLLLGCIVMTSASVTNDGSIDMETTDSTDTTTTNQPMTTDDFQDTSSAAQGDGRFCNKSLTYTVKTECKPCAVNALSSCPLGLIQLTQVSSLLEVKYDIVDV